MGSATDLHSGGRGFEFSWHTGFFLFENLYFWHTCFLKFNFDTTVTWHSKHASKQDLSEIKCTSSGNSKSCFCPSLQRVEGTGVEKTE